MLRGRQVAGQTKRYEATLVTSNVAEFKRVSELKWENWAELNGMKRLYENPGRRHEYARLEARLVIDRTRIA